MSITIRKLTREEVLEGAKKATQDLNAYLAELAKYEELDIELQVREVEVTHMQNLRRVFLKRVTIEVSKKEVLVEV